jgi:N-acetyl-anhydromuramyl-L-alanine amidase AmpD
VRVFFLFVCVLLTANAQTNLTLPITKNLVDFGFIKLDSIRTPDVVILHSSYCPTLSDSFNLECILKLYQKYEVSAHYIIAKNGEIVQLVEENNISHHGGKGTLPDGNNKINTRSIGIELINTKSSSYSEIQIAQLKSLLIAIKSRFKIKYILGHSEIAPDRKTDPWNFDWNWIRSDSTFK